MKKTKLLHLAISLILILCLFAGCSRPVSDKVKDDTKAPASEAVSESAEAEADTNELVGTLEEITMDSITLRMMDGRILTFNTNNVKHSFSYGITEGNWVTVVYSGELEGTDTSKIAVIEIHDEDTDYVKSVKAQTKIDNADDTVYALETIVVRSSYMMASESVGTLKSGESVKRTGHCNNGWDRIIFHDKEAYVYGTLLTTNPNETSNKGEQKEISKVVKMKELNETVYAKTDAAVRQGYSTASKQIGALKAGVSVTRTGICDNGWSRINYNGLVAFVYSDLLTTENPNSEKEGVKITAVNETVYATRVVNVRKSWSEKSEIIGTLKYGENIVRTGICDNGWSRVTYDKKDAYISSDYLSKTKPADSVKIYKVSGYAWTVTKSNVRESWSADSKSLGVLEKNTGIEITGVTDNNWSRVNYNGKVGFIHNDLLTSKNPNPPKPAPKPETKATETKAPESKETKAPESKETKAPETETKATETKATETKAPETETKAPETETKAPETETKAPETETKAPETETAAPETETKAPETETAAPETEAPETETAAPETEAPETETAAPETETEAPETETAAPETEAPEEHEIQGIVVGYNIESITIMVDDKSADPEKSGSSGSDSTATITYEQADGKVTTYITFDITQASQSYSQGIDEGLIVKVTYVGNLETMEGVRAVSVTDEGIKQTTKTFRGMVVSYENDTLVLDCGEGVETSFDCKKASGDKDKIAEGAKVCVIADLKDASKTDTVFKAVKISIEK